MNFDKLTPFHSNQCLLIKVIKIIKHGYWKFFPKKVLSTTSLFNSQLAYEEWRKRLCNYEEWYCNLCSIPLETVHNFLYTLQDVLLNKCVECVRHPARHVAFNEVNTDFHLMYRYPETRKIRIKISNSQLRPSAR